jgi:hypothetical protein
MTALEEIVQYVEAGASEEQIQTGNYAERYINALTNYELLKLLSDVSEAKEPA